MDHPNHRSLHETPTPASVGLACLFFVLPALLILLMLTIEPAWARGAYSFRYPNPQVALDPNADTVIGVIGEHVTQKKDTLLDIARDNNLGFNELEVLYPDIDPCIPPEGSRLTLPTQWILPPTAKYGIVINIAEMRLYDFVKHKNSGIVRTFPIGIGRDGFESPIGRFTIINKTVNPSWHVPKSIREEKPELPAVVPPGPDNPLGELS